MKLDRLLGTLKNYKLHGSDGIDIGAVTCDSRRVVPGTLFFALPGASVNGHQFIPAAVSAGAAAIVLEDEHRAPVDIPWIRVPDGRTAMARMAAEFYGNPTASLPLIGITGTNGKTTTTYLIEAILREAGLPAAVLGTISYRFSETVITASHTTPESTELQAAFSQLKTAGARSFVMEVSSHALEQRRVDGCSFDVGIFSNLTRDHLDYHATMENYREAKLRFFTELLRPDEVKPRRRAVVNRDDEQGEFFAQRAVCPVIGYGIDHYADVRVTNASLTRRGISGTLVTSLGSCVFSSHLLGRFNLSNILAAVAAGVAMELPLEAIVRGIERHDTVPGRMERVDNRCGFTLLVDYAHTSDALENALFTLRELKPARIITVFGCGGDRDPGKRPLMGAAAAGMSDLAIVTSDNPRSEEPATIMTQIREGILPLGVREYQLEELLAPSHAGKPFTEKGFVMVENRREAIRLAVALAREDDIVLLAGKGHEDYQIIGTTKHHFDDREEAASAIAIRENACSPSMT